MKTLLLAGIALAASAPAFAGSVPTTYVSKNGLDDLGGGSGVVIGPHEILTANHNVNDCMAINVDERDAYVAAHDEGNDLAVVHTKDAWASWASFSNQPVRAGDAVVAMGYPLSGFLADTPNVSPGSVSALAGIRNDSRFLQITAPVQPGNSGGALYDVNGGIVGIVRSKLGLDYTKETGDLPQNVSFAIKSDIVRSFLDSNHVKYETITYNLKLSPADIGEKTRPFTVRIACYGHEQKEAKREQPPPPPPPPTNPSGPTGNGNVTVYRVIQNLMLRAEPNKGAWNVLSAYAPNDYIPEGTVFTMPPNPTCRYGNGQEVWCHVYYDRQGLRLWGWISAHFLADNSGVLLACRYNTPEPKCGTAQH